VQPHGNLPKDHPEDSSIITLLHENETDMNERLIFDEK
jgi:hypothetical protein